jgi:hypothetical protein
LASYDFINNYFSSFEQILFSAVLMLIYLA